MRNYTPGITIRALILRINRTLERETKPQRKDGWGEWVYDKQPRCKIHGSGCRKSAYLQIRETNDRDHDGLKRRGKYYLVLVEREKWLDGYETIESFREGFVDLRAFAKKTGTLKKGERVQQTKSEQRMKKGRDV
jgi:hypothetical protein